MTTLNRRDVARGAAEARKLLGVRNADSDAATSPKPKNEDQERDEPKVNDQGYYVDDDGNFVDADGDPSDEPVKADDDDDSEHDENGDDKDRGERAVPHGSPVHSRTGRLGMARGAAEARKLLGR